ncbi:MAG: MATE family efflux transporter [Defluviitaleaceae bacterium]|nr:MATE family efflux transporter [Defluviitaleaceae bacterium]MCL2274530.1 MATE family efflux transporter [Defluviitaleaceae bacterium]
MEPENQQPKAIAKAEKEALNIAKTPTRTHLIKFAAPTIISMLIMSTFGIVDGIFVSRLIDPFALSAVGLIWPFMSFVMAIGFMLGVGGNALIAKMIGEKRIREARQIFSLITAVAFVASIAVSLVGYFAPYFIMNILGVDDFMRPMAQEYMTPFIFFLPAAILGMVLQQFLITVGKAHYSAVMSLLSGLISAGLNYTFIYQMDMGLRGAALATSLGMMLPVVVGITYFTFARKGDLFFVMPRFHFRALKKLGRSCVNGASEMVASLAASITAILMNNKLMDMEGAGPEAVAASAIMWAGMGIFASIFMGYNSGVAPIISYNYGKGDKENLRRVFKNSLILIGILSVSATVLALSTVDVLAFIYDVPRGTNIHRLVRIGYIFITCTFLLMGFNSFGSMFFTALNNGIISSILALFNTFIFYIIALYSLAPIFGLYGVWGAVPFADFLQIFLTVFMLFKFRKRYDYA